MLNLINNQLKNPIEDKISYKNLTKQKEFY